MSAPATLDEFVCFAMYTASHATTQAYREVLKPWKLTYPQYLALIVLAAGERTVSGLGDELGLDSGTLSPLLRRLEDRGLVLRRRDAADERVVRVALTAAGREVPADVVGAAGSRGAPVVESGRGLGEPLEQLAAITANMRALAADLRTAA
ncbi:MarR family winged helix-turn-helix transcriptional regulator [Microbacterium hominis]|uniref:MarR family winged helix-turn-helix transcriptional regulator n=1 Tax=Microbacterium hominis TaxID=162426 RepID=UPI00076862EF|nr:MarR family transcriptional regulator [Microbacterium hominis]KXC05894.1 transcriptional regulator [Microbacterium hominis]